MNEIIYKREKKIVKMTFLNVLQYCLRLIKFFNFNFLLTNLLLDTHLKENCTDTDTIFTF